MKKLVLTCFLSAAVISLAAPVQAAFTLTLSQAGNNVVLTGAGSLNTTGLTTTALGGTVPFSASSATAIAGIGSANNTRYSGIAGPASFGSGSSFFANSSTGTFAGLGNQTSFIVAAGYVSGTLISNSSTFSNQTISGLGVTPGTYVYTWGTGVAADSLTLNVPAVPEPSTWAFVGAGAGWLGFATLRRRRAIRLA